MKNKKLIPITVCLVVAVLVGMLGLSKFFETTWQNENTVDNSLSAEVVDDVETIFDYPFVIDNGETIDWDNKYMTTPPEGAITWQQAANVAGETLKYMFGYTDHQKNQAKMCYYDRPEEPSDSTFPGVKCYYYYFPIYNAGEEFIGEAFVMIDPFTGEPMLFQLIDEPNNDDVEWPEYSETENSIDKQKLLSSVSAVLNYLGNNEIKKIGVGQVGLSTEMYGKSVIKSYVLNVELTDNTRVELYVNIDDKTDYALLSYRNLTALKNVNSADFFTNFVIYP